MLMAQQQAQQQAVFQAAYNASFQAMYTPEMQAQQALQQAQQQQQMNAIYAQQILSQQAVVSQQSAAAAIAAQYAQHRRPTVDVAPLAAVAMPAMDLAPVAASEAAQKTGRGQRTKVPPGGVEAPRTSAYGRRISPSKRRKMTDVQFDTYPGSCVWAK